MESTEHACRTYSTFTVCNMYILIGQTNHEQIRSRNNNSWCRMFQPCRPLQLTKAYQPKHPVSVVIDSAMYLLTISLPNINYVAISLYNIMYTLAIYCPARGTVYVWHRWMRSHLCTAISLYADELRLIAIFSHRCWIMKMCECNHIVGVQWMDFLMVYIKANSTGVQFKGSVWTVTVCRPLKWQGLDQRRVVPPRAEPVAPLCHCTRHSLTTTSPFLRRDRWVGIDNQDILSYLYHKEFWPLDSSSCDSTRDPSLFFACCTLR